MLLFINGNYIGHRLAAQSRYAVRYIKNVYKNDRHEKQQLLSKVFAKENNSESLEQLYTYSVQNLMD